MVSWPGRKGHFPEGIAVKKRVAIVQSNYVPWKGYFDIINMVDEFILFDDMQYTRRDWRNRNKIKTPRGPIWITIPVDAKGKYLQTIKETKISDLQWGRKHWDTIIHHYSKAAHFKTCRDVFEELYLGCNEEYLSLINYRFISAICRLLGIGTTITWSMDYRLTEGKTEKLIDLCKQAGATEYVSGPLAKGYIDEALFEQEGIALTWMDYSDYPEYPQLHPPFDHYVSIIDLILNAGPDSTRFMKSF